MARITVTTSDGVVVETWDDNVPCGYGDLDLAKLDLTKTNGILFTNSRDVMYLGEEVADAVRHARRMEGG